jgi:hypothetical protein
VVVTQFKEQVTLAALDQMDRQQHLFLALQLILLVAVEEVYALQVMQAQL